MPLTSVVNPDDATPVRSVTTPIVIVFDPLEAGLDPALDPPDEPDEPHAAKAVPAATSRTAHPEIRLRIGEPSTTSRLQRHNVTPGDASCPSGGRTHYRNRYGHDYGMGSFIPGSRLIVT